MDLSGGLGLIAFLVVELHGLDLLLQVCHRPIAEGRQLGCERVYSFLCDAIKVSASNVQDIVDCSIRLRLRGLLLFAFVKLLHEALQFA